MHRPMQGIKDHKEAGNVIASEEMNKASDN